MKGCVVMKEENVFNSMIQFLRWLHRGLKIARGNKVEINWAAYLERDGTTENIIANLLGIVLVGKHGLEAALRQISSAEDKGVSMRTFFSLEFHLPEEVIFWLDDVEQEIDWGITNEWDVMGEIIKFLREKYRITSEIS